MKKESRHVVPKDGAWAVRKSGAERASRVFDRKEDAVTYGREKAKSEKTELYIHKKDGTIQNKNSYGNDPMPPKDKK